MSKEAPRPHDQGFTFTEREQLYYRISHERFRTMFDDKTTTIHRIEVSYNSYGEFLFVTASQETEHGRQPITFYGLGFHDYRGRWISKEWFWYKANAHPATTTRIVPKAEAQEALNQRLEEITPYVTEDQQTRRDQLFELLADLTDDDGALAEMDDLGIDDLE